jgi:BirA family transcriptional regulator, biotin operon repressor / biotin---[acetyl-CoA-carboxylase] ligase
MSLMIEQLDAVKILSAISQENQRNLSKLDIFDTIGSTNTYLLECAKLNLLSGHVVVANQQTNGRGRHGKDWFSPADSNIYFSLLWHFSQLAFELSGLAIVVGVIIAKFLGRYGIKQGIQLKWPNDVLFSDKKLAGILLESNVPQTMVIGIGLNLYFSQDDARAISPAAISIYDIIRRCPPRNYLIGLLINELFEQLRVYENAGLAAFLQDWRDLDYFLNKNITVHTPEREISGIMAGINEYGELLLHGDEGSLHTFRYGTVSVRRKG